MPGIMVGMDQKDSYVGDKPRATVVFDLQLSDSALCTVANKEME